jgi:CheY-like chemotaxis protein
MLDHVREVMERQTRQMGRLVDDLLDISRITRGKISLKKERLDLLRIVQTALETSRPHLDARRHKLLLCLPMHPVWLDADATRLEQVLANLLNNAAKYSEPVGEIWLSVTMEDQQAVLRVRDHGIGIAPEVLPRIFDLFAQADRSLDRSQGGLGIGLTLVRRLVEMHGGTVEAASDGLGLGSEFTVRLPLAPETGDERPERAPEAESGRGHNLNILVVDDNVDEATSLSLVLRMHGYATKTVYNGPAALEAARIYQPDVVLLDIGLPGMDGYEVARQLPEAVRTRPLLIAVTGYSQDENRRRAAEVGFDRYLLKPVDLQQLHQLLAEAA